MEIMCFYVNHIDLVWGSDDVKGVTDSNIKTTPERFVSGVVTFITYFIN